MRIRLAAAAAAIVLGVMPLAACGGSSSSAPVDGPPAVSGAFGPLHLAVCEAADAAGAGDEVGAAEAFDDVHGPLHELAAATEAEDRAIAARLLEAKQAVEAGAGAEAYRTLVMSVEDAIEATGDEVGKCS